MYKIVCSPHRGPLAPVLFPAVHQLALFDFTGTEKGGLTQVKKIGRVARARPSVVPTTEAGVWKTAARAVSQPTSI